MTDDGTFELSRRKALAGIGTIGVASAGAGLGTSAFFSDEENFENNRLTAGALDLKVDWSEHYSDWSDDEADGITVSMTDSSVGPGFPSAAANKMVYVSDKDAFLKNTAIEAFPDVDNDGVQDFPSDFDICTYDGQPEEGDALPDGVGADTPAVLRDEYRTNTNEAGPNRAAGDPIGGAEPAGNPQATAPGDPLVNISDVKPGDFGEVTFSLHLCGNPGYIWMTGDLVDADENGTNEPEEADPDEIGPGETDPQMRDLFDNEGDESNEENADPANTTQEPVELLDAINAAVWYDTGDDGAYGTGGGGEGDNYHQSGEAFIPIGGSLRNVLKVLRDGMVPLDYSPTAGSGNIGTGGGGGTNFDVCTSASDAIHVLTNSSLGIASARNVSCEELDEMLVMGGYVEIGTEYVGTKIEAGNLQTGTYTAGNGGIIQVNSVDIAGGSVELSTNFPIESVKIKGGNQGANYYVFEDQGGTDPSDNTDEQFGCVLDTVTMSTPTGQAISNIEICYDPDTPTDGEVPGQDVGRECFPNSTTAYIGFEWWLPVDHANEIQSDSVEFDLGFYTEQCRHNDGSGQPPEGS